MKLKLPRMLAQDFEPADFALYLMLKDARYAAALRPVAGRRPDMTRRGQGVRARRGQGTRREGYRGGGGVNGRPGPMAEDEPATRSPDMPSA